MGQPKFSFVLPAFKTRFLTDAIRSILNQTYTDFELIIVNDASPEPVKEVVLQFQDARIQYYENETNIGGKDLIENWNRCIQRANGEYTILASDDDRYDSLFLAEIDLLTGKYPQVNIFRSRIDKIDENDKIVDVDLSFPEYLSQLQFLHFWSRESMHHCIANFVYRTEVLKQRKFVNFPAAWYSDDATAILLADKGIVNTQKVLTHFRISSITISNSSNKHVLTQKFRATNLFYEWITGIIQLANADNTEAQLAESRALVQHYSKKYINHIVRYDTLGMSKKHFLFCLKQLAANKTMYKKEKMLLYIEYLLK